jgi:hypothetical protein
MQPAALHLGAAAPPPYATDATDVTRDATHVTRGNQHDHPWPSPGTVGLCRLNQVDPCPITYNLSNP